MKKKEGCSELTSKGSAEDTLLLQDKIRESSAMEREMTGEIILYQPDATLSLQVKLDAAHDTVWLTQQQMAELFQRDRSVIAKHIRSVFAEQELVECSNVQILHNTFSKYKPTTLYSLDVIISVGYRVKSKRGTLFRQWANKVLKDHLLKGYSVNHHLVALQQQIDSRFEVLESRVDQQQEKLDLLVKTHSLPEEKLFPNGCVWDAYTFVSGLIRSAKEQVILIDNFVDETVLTLLDKRADGVKAVVHSRFSEGFLRELDRHNEQYPQVEFVQLPHKIHDRFLIIDSQVYLLGNSLKDMGHTLSAAILTSFSVDDVISKLR